MVTNVFWGTDAMNPGTVHAGDVNVQLSIVLSNVGDDVARDVNGTLFLTPPIDYTLFRKWRPKYSHFRDESRRRYECSHTIYTHLGTDALNQLPGMEHTTAILSYRTSQRENCNKSIRPLKWISQSTEASFTSKPYPQIQLNYSQTATQIK